MAFKEKLIGVVLIIVGALPFLLKISAVNSLVGGYEFIMPGQTFYHAMIIILGVLLLIRIPSREERLREREAKFLRR
ncbi:hypothetical protein COV15_01395 [Candidatus Woesearchaeota archaeon CG10_big_fil_rev_8_21_14_0_10_34_12]|nr:MAG: hypothetical protein COV15_01395 [Candidatus Woesearchaeota archaeon CG10_big_fil_rev_8_21_14_0_10_34_12]